MGYRLPAHSIDKKTFSMVACGLIIIIIIVVDVVLVILVNLLVNLFVLCCFSSPPSFFLHQ